jgi:hypothetical protein
MSRQDTNLCTGLSPECPVELTVYGYRPNIGANAFFVASFALLAVMHLGLGIRGKTWFFCGVMIAGCIGEAIGYAGRILLWNNPVCFIPPLD